MYNGEVARNVDGGLRVLIGKNQLQASGQIVSLKLYLVKHRVPVELC